MNTCDISIIIPVYNVKAYIGRCIKSVLLQTSNLNIECILVDDHSTDESMDVAKQVILKCKRKNITFRVVENEKNGGVSYCRNIGLKLSKGKYIMFLDSDDFIPSNAISSLYPQIQETNVVFVSGQVTAVKDDTCYIHNNKWRINAETRFNGEEFFRAMIQGSVCNAVWNKLYVADIIKKISFCEGIINEDSLFLYELSKTMKNNNLIAIVIPSDTYYYTNRDNGYCNSNSLALQCNTCDNLKYFYQDSKRNNYDIRDELLHTYVKQLYFLILRLMRNYSRHIDILNTYIVEWQNISTLDIIKVLKPKQIRRGVAIKYCPSIWIKWTNYRLNKSII